MTICVRLTVWHPGFCGHKWRMKMKKTIRNLIFEVIIMCLLCFVFAGRISHTNFAYFAYEASLVANILFFSVALQSRISICARKLEICKIPTLSSLAIFSLGSMPMTTKSVSWQLSVFNVCILCHEKGFWISLHTITLQRSAVLQFVEMWLSDTMCPILYALDTVRALCVVVVW